MCCLKLKCYLNIGQNIHLI